jgi:hypothetical protein
VRRCGGVKRARHPNRGGASDREHCSKDFVNLPARDLRRSMEFFAKLALRSTRSSPTTGQPA